ncbi:hypothetical protein R5W24_004295 [Gemmata sp. JC717]|uniref:hypothetical protein n=1 Tax=Gemmata algarum TaxID=2975278 RepID=UPI0021BA8D0B|nr:hypothetical protein [Gemmata algarum]MDY3555157.1 hypothetical protein [Gemmata algarum]
MSWELHYTLPWDVLDRDRIHAAAEHVVGTNLGLTRYEIDDRGPDLVWVFFYFPAALERRLGHSDAERNFPLHGIADGDEAFVHFTFEHIPPDNGYELPRETYFEFYSNISGNFIFAGVGIEVADRLGKHFGVTCRPD